MKKAEQAYKKLRKERTVWFIVTLNYIPSLAEVTIKSKQSCYRGRLYFDFKRGKNIPSWHMKNEASVYFKDLFFTKEDAINAYVKRVKYCKNVLTTQKNRLLKKINNLEDELTKIESSLK